MPMSHHALEVSPRTFSATCQNMQYRGQDWNVPVSQFIPKCPAQGQAEHHEMGQGMVDPLQNQADNTSFLTQQKAPHKHRPQKSKCLINQGAVFLFKKKKCRPLLELPELENIFQTIVWLEQIFHVAKDTGRIHSESPQGNCGWFFCLFVSKVFPLLLG